MPGVEQAEFAEGYMACAEDGSLAFESEKEKMCRTFDYSVIKGVFPEEEALVCVYRVILAVIRHDKASVPAQHKNVVTAYKVFKLESFSVYADTYKKLCFHFPSSMIKYYIRIIDYLIAKVNTM